MSSPDFQLVDGVFCRLADRETAGPDAINDIEQVVLLVWHAEGIIGNGGFHYFFECGLPLRATAQAYTRIGVQPAATILLHLLALFPRQVIPDDWDERMELVEKLESSHRDLIEGWEQEFFETADITERQLAGWIRVHQDVFNKSDGTTDRTDPSSP
jgi:hypothetical protein